MPTTMLYPSNIGVMFFAVAKHGYFKKYEPTNLLTPLLMMLIEPVLLTWGYNPTTNLALFPSLSEIMSAYIVYLVTITISIVIHRLSPCHPLANIPGPMLFKVSKFFSLWYIWKGSHCMLMKRMHDYYGPVVRTGPNEISVIDAQMTRRILGPSGLPKGAYYEARRNPQAPSTLFTLTGEAHSLRRRKWNRAMNAESIAAYTEMIGRRVSELIDHLTPSEDSTTCGETTRKMTRVVDINEWLSFLTLDIMGDIAFGGGFEMMKGSEEVRNGFYGVMSTFARYASVICQIPWAFRDLSKLPFIAKKSLSIRRVGAELAKRRVEEGSQARDLWYHLNDEMGFDKVKPSLSAVVADGALAVVAGSDTVSAALACLLYLLLTHPDVYKELQAEIDRVYPPGESTLTSAKHSQLPFLKACLNETLRLFPPIPTNGPRQVPLGCGGQMIGDRFIPEGTHVYTPAYARHRCAAYFSPSPDEFRPSRWLSRESSPSSVDSEDEGHGPERNGSSDGATEILEKDAFLPFSYGPANCVGKALGKQEMMIVMSSLIQQFNFCFAPGLADADIKQWPNTIQDFFFTIRGKLTVEIRTRTTSF